MGPLFETSFVIAYCIQRAPRLLGSQTIRYRHTLPSQYATVPITAIFCVGRLTAFVCLARVQLLFLLGRGLSRVSPALRVL